MKILREVLMQFAEWTKLKVRLHVADDIDFYFHEREIWWACLGVNVGFEQDRKNNQFERPILVLKKFNKYVLWILPLTSKKKKGKYYFPITYNGEEYKVILSQLRLISSKRLTRKIRTLSRNEFNEIRQKIKSFL